MNPGPKFRVWDIKNNEWLGESDPNTLTYYGFHLFGEVMTMQHMPGEMLGHIIIEQSIGLKDKNGNEIYEGDIVKISCGDAENLAVCKWTSERSRFVLEDVRKYPEKSTTELFPKNLLVIGNIHKNPELLEVK